MNYPFYFEIESDNSMEQQYEINCGYGICSSYTDAMEQLEKYFGNDICQIKNLQLMEESQLLFFPRKVCEEYNKSWLPAVDFVAEVRKYND